MEETNRHNTYNTLFNWHNLRVKLVFEGIIVGILTGFTVVLYRFILEKLGGLTDLVYLYLKKNYVFIPVWFIILFFIGFIISKLLKHEPMVSGSGIPQVEGILQRQLSVNWWKVLLGKFFGGVLAIGGGLSLGREGPSIQLGASLGQGFSRVFKRIRVEEKYLITSGASAGLSAAFSAPLAGVMFSLEEVHKNFSPLVLLSAMSASLTADFICKSFFGLNPVFDFHMLTPIPLKYYLYLIALGVIVGIFGVLFNSTLLKTQDMYSRIKWLPAELRPVLPLILAGFLGFFLPQVLGGGNDLISALVKSNYTLKLLLILLIFKFGFTMLSYGSGAPGGIFLPLLVVGALTGNIYGEIVAKVFHVNPGYISNFIILAMAGYFTAIVKAPITGSILITEMTGSFSHLLSLAIVSITSYIITDMLGSEPIYELLLERLLKNKGNNAFKGDSKTKVILEFAVCIGSALDGKMIKEIEWPAHCLLVAVKRGDKEIIPKGNVLIYPGDYLIVLANEEEAPEIRNSIIEMTGRCTIDDID